MIAECKYYKIIVLILVLVEYALRVDGNGVKVWVSLVLILVLVEYALRVKDSFGRLNYDGLNPCFSGICSSRTTKTIPFRKRCCLNPCFSGICSSRDMLKYQSICNKTVLILVLVEYALRVDNVNLEIIDKKSLNPCFSGICSSSANKFC